MPTNCTATNMIPSPGTWVVDPVAGKGDFTTITAAVAAASNTQTIYVRPGTYTENFTTNKQLSIVGASVGSGANPSQVVIVGKISNSSTTNINISDLMLQTNGDYAISNSSSGRVYLNNCIINANDSAAIENSGTGAVLLYFCSGIGTGGAFFSVSSSGSLQFTNCSIDQNGLTTASNTSSGVVLIYNSWIRTPISTSSTGSMQAFNSFIQDAGSVISLTINGSTLSQFYNCVIFGNGANEPITIGGGASVLASNCAITTSAANAVTGTGSFSYSGIDFTSTKTMSVTTQTPVSYSVPQGGTGVSSFTAYAPIIAGTTTTGNLSSVAPSATSGVPFISQGSSSNPTFGTAVVAGGGTGVATQAAYSLVCGGTTTTGAFQAINPVAVGQVLISSGTGALPAFSANPTVTQITLGSSTVGSLPAAGSNTYASRFVTDALAPIFGSTVAAGGAVKTPVWSDGTNWIVG